MFSKSLIWLIELIRPYLFDANLWSVYVCTETLIWFDQLFDISQKTERRKSSFHFKLHFVSVFNSFCFERTLSTLSQLTSISLSVKFVARAKNWAGAYFEWWIFKLSQISKLTARSKAWAFSKKAKQRWWIKKIMNCILSLWFINISEQWSVD